MTPGLALWLAIAFLAYCALGRVCRGGARVLLALAWPVGVVYLLLADAVDDLKRMVNRL